MSRFFHGGDSSSESSSDEEELYSDNEEQQPHRTQARGSDDEPSSEEESSEEEDEGEEEESSSDDEGLKTGASRFMKDVSDSEESEDEDKVTILKSAKDKRLEELEGTVRAIENAEKINDWAVISTEFDKLNRQLPKLLQSGPMPRLYIRICADLEDTMNETMAKQKVSTKKMNATNARGLNAVKQRIKKTNKDHATEIEKYRSDKTGYMAEEVEEEAVPVEKVKKSKAARIEDLDAAIDDEGFSTVGKGGKTLVYAPESILKHLRSIIESRGKKNTDRQEQIRVMERLLEVATTPYHKIRLLLTLISTRFDLTTGSTSNYMSADQWKDAEKELSQLLETLEENPQWIVVENGDDWDDDEKPPPQPAPGNVFKIGGSIPSSVERLDDELTRSLQHIDPHTSEYIERLKHEQLLYNDLVRSLIYVESLKANPKAELSQDNLNRLVMRRLEHIYFKPRQVITILEEKCWQEIPSQLDSKITPRSSDKTKATSLIQTLCTYLFTNSEGILRARAMLCQVYHLALHDSYYQSRDLLLMSHLQETISSFDVSSQILFNRTLVQVGLCAFRAGLVYEAQNTLQEICGSGRQKELLAQGVMMQRYSQVSPEQERLERQRQLPFHMHINLELLECVYLTCSMLLEIPLLAQTGSSPDLKKRVISKTFRRMLEYTERQVFTGPPENTRDHVMQASRALAAGEWQKSSRLINAIKIWDLMPAPDKIKTMLAAQIQEEGLRTYLFTYAPFYDTIALATLSSMFDLSTQKVSATISRMISHEELAAALDQVNNAVIFRKGVELSRLQSQVITMSEKAMALLESNEKVLETRTQGTGNPFQRQDPRGGDRRRGGGGGGRGGRIGGNTGGASGGSGGQRRPNQGNQTFGGGAMGNMVRSQG